MSYTTIRVYLAGIRLFHIENHFPHPAAEAPLLHYLCNGIRRCTGDLKLKRQPITIPQLHSIKIELSCDSSLHPRDKLLYGVAFTLAFYGFLCSSEYTSPTHYHYNQRRPLLRKDITLNNNSMKVHIKVSKPISTDKWLTFLSAKLAHLPAPSMPCINFWSKPTTVNAHPSFLFTTGNT